MSRWYYVILPNSEIKIIEELRVTEFIAKLPIKVKEEDAKVPAKRVSQYAFRVLFLMITIAGILTKIDRGILEKIKNFFVGS